LFLDEINLRGYFERDMEKGKPHHSLEKIRRLVRAGAVQITGTAIKSAALLGLLREDILEVVCSLTPDDFYKSMTSYVDFTCWQDVYHPKLSGKTIYLKLTVQGDALVLSFKEK